MPFAQQSASVRTLALVVLALGASAALRAQEAPAGPDLFAPLPPIPELGMDPAFDQSLTEIDVPPSLLPVPPPDPGLVAPLPPLDGFDPAPRTDFQFTEVAQEGVRYQMVLEGLQPTGLEGQFRRLSALARGQNRPATAAQIASRANADEKLLKRLLFSEGWYGATTDVGADFSVAGRAEIRLSTVPGDRYTWREIALDLIPADRPELAADFGLEVGDAIRAIDVEEAEGALLRRLNEAGYPFSEIGARDVVLDADKPKATYLLTGDLGLLGIFGPIRMSGFQPFDEAHAQVIARFEPGDPYDVRLVDDLRRALIATQSFGGLTVTAVDSGLREADGRAVTEIQIQGNRGPQRLLTGQIGFATEEGFRAEGSWRHRNFIEPEGMLTTRAVLGTDEQRARAELLMSNWRQRDRSLEFAADLANLTPPAYNAQTFALTAEIGRASTPIWQKRWTWAIGFGLGASRERQRGEPDPRDGSDTGFDVTRQFLFVSLPGRVGYDRSNDLLDPTRGFRLNLEVNPEISRENSNVETYARLFADGSYYQPVGTSFVLAGRLRLGSIVGAELFSIAPTRRLYAGGGGSVRGFDYQEVGETGLNGRPIGGRSLFESSIEGRYRLGAFGIAAFVDAGSASASSVPSLDGTRFGVGVGGRYYTSFGPLRIDVARAINRTSRDPVVALYISLGQAF
ncbi:MAG: autotransporter assembly complex protein TamA [Sandaracinobacteroides sp.]